jgi:hypothetical protein
MYGPQILAGEDRRFLGFVRENPVFYFSPLGRGPLLSCFPRKLISRYADIIDLNKKRH